MNKTELLALLRAYAIPLEEWGRGEAKTFDRLAEEIESRESSIIEEAGNLIRLIEGAGLLLYYRDRTRTWRLREDRQVFKDGRVRNRSYETAPSEKIRPNEQPIAAAYRALQEELGIFEHLPLKAKGQIVDGPISSMSFPGLSTRYIIHVFEADMPDHLYKPEGYVEEQPDKTTYFVWRED